MNEIDKSKPMLLVLDLDETLIYSCETPLSRAADFRVQQFHVYRRPFLNEFLCKCEGWYKLAVWSTASDNYVRAIVNEVFPDPSMLEFVWGQSRSSVRRVISGNSDFDMHASGHTNFQKHLKKVSKLGWPIERILIVDDSPEKSAQNYGNAIYPRPFEGDQGDEELKLLSAYLETLKDCPNVRKVEKRGWRSSVQKLNHS